MMRIVSWNIRQGGGSRAGAICRCLDGWAPDCVVLSEFRGTVPSREIANHLEAKGLAFQVDSVDPEDPNKYALFIASRFPLTRLEDSRVVAAPPRWIAVEVASEGPFILMGMHVPKRDSGRKWEFLSGVVRDLEKRRHEMAIAVGDTNSGRKGVDEESAFFMDREDEWFDRINEAGWSDVYRERNPTARTFSWYSTHGNGFRLDQVLATKSMEGRIHAVRYDWGEPDRPSDHAAVLVDVG